MTSTQREWASLARELGATARINELLAPHTTLRIGGPADLFVNANSVSELVTSVRLARKYQAPILVLGRGSNVLVPDSGWRGLVIANNSDHVELTNENQDLFVRAESGSSLPGLASRTARLGWRGLEWGIGVPGSIGGGVVGNAGGHGGSVADNLVSVRILDPDSNNLEVKNADCEFGYRTSRFKQRRGGEVILEAIFRLERDSIEACIARMNQYTEHRRRSQPTEPSIGSMFKNPPNDYAGRLIDAAGLKGTRSGQIGVSTVHGNFFVNHGGATSADVLNLIELVRGHVKEKFKVELELEIEIIGSGE